MNQTVDELTNWNLKDYEDYNRKYDADEFMRYSEASKYDLDTMKKWIEIRDDFEYTDDTAGSGWECFGITQRRTKYGTNLIYVNTDKMLWRYKESASEFYGSRPNRFDLDKYIENRRQKKANMSDLSNETDLDQSNYYEIYQLKRDLPNRRDLSFISFDELTGSGEKLDRSNYDLVYTHSFNGETLDDIYRIYNIDHPDDFKGHSLSVSDVVVIHDSGESRAYYVDSAGFVNVPDFLKSIDSSIFDDLIADHYFGKVLAEKNREALINAYKETEGKTPANTIAALIDNIGYERAVKAVAESINATSDDGRISRDVCEWANKQDCASKQDLENYGLYSIVSWLHPAHLNQIGLEMMKKEKEMKKDMKINKTISEHFGNYVDKDAWDTDVDMTVGFVADLRDLDNNSKYDQFLSYLADNIIVIEDNTDSMVCDFSGFFEKHQEELRYLYDKAGWRLEDEFDDDEIHYDFVSSVLPQMISGNANGNAYKLFLDAFSKGVEQEDLLNRAVNRKNNEVINVLGEVFSEYSKHFDPINSEYDEQKLLDADKTYNYLYKLLHSIEMNQGYRIINISKPENGEISYAIGYDKDAPNPYVVWSTFVDRKGERHFSSGHYTNSLYEAVRIQAELSGSKYLKNDMFDTVNMTLLLNRYYDNALAKAVFRSGGVSDFVNNCVNEYRNWDKTLDDDIRDFNTLDSMNEFIEDTDYLNSEFIDEIKGKNKGKGIEL